MSRLLYPWESPFFLMFLAGLDIIDGSFEVLIFSYWFYRLPWYFRSPEHNECLSLHWKSVSRLPFPLKITFLFAVLAILAIFDVPDCSSLSLFGSLTCDKCRTTWDSHITFKKCIRTAVYFDKHHFAVLDVPDSSLEVLIVSDGFSKVLWLLRMQEYCKSLLQPWKKCVKTAVFFCCKLDSLKPPLKQQILIHMPCKFISLMYY